MNAREARWMNDLPSTVAQLNRAIDTWRFGEWRGEYGVRMPRRTKKAWKKMPRRMLLRGGEWYRVRDVLLWQRRRLIERGDWPT